MSGPYRGFYAIGKDGFMEVDSRECHRIRDVEYDPRGQCFLRHKFCRFPGRIDDEACLQIGWDFKTVLIEQTLSLKIEAARQRACIDDRQVDEAILRGRGLSRSAAGDLDRSALEVVDGECEDPVNDRAAKCFEIRASIAATGGEHERGSQESTDEARHPQDCTRRAEAPMGLQ